MWELTSEKTWSTVERIREKKPRILACLQPGSGQMAESLVLPFSARVLMGTRQEEAGELAEGADAVVVDLGASDGFEPLYTCLKTAAGTHTPAVLVLTGIDMSGVRRGWAVKMLETKGVTLLLGSAAEMCALLMESSPEISGKTDFGEDEQILSVLSVKYGCMCLLPGTVGLLAAGRRVIAIHNGVPVMDMIPGRMACTAVFAAAFLTAEVSDRSAAAAAAVLEICGEIARRKSKTSAQGGSGTFAAELVDAVSLLSRPSLIGRIRTEILQDTEEEKS